MSRFTGVVTAALWPALATIFGEVVDFTDELGATTQVTVIAEPQVGALDDSDRMIFYGLAAGALSDVQRSQYFVRAGDTRRWQVVDSKVNAGIVRALSIAPIERT